MDDEHLRGLLSNPSWGNIILAVLLFITTVTAVVLSMLRPRDTPMGMRILLLAVLFLTLTSVATAVGPVASLDEWGQLAIRYLSLALRAAVLVLLVTHIVYQWRFIRRR